MTKAEFTDKVAAKSGLSKRDATKAVDAFLDSITEALRSGEQVAFTGFGRPLCNPLRAARHDVVPVVVRPLG